MRLIASPVKRIAVHHGIPVFEPATLKTVEARAPVVQIPLDVLVVAAYGLILPQSVLAWPRYGCVNVHASLLPRWRGAAPIQRAIEAGDGISGITIMQMDAGLDTGPIISSTSVPIASTDTGGSLSLKLADAGATAVVEALTMLAAKETLTYTPQPDDRVTYAQKVTADDARVQWTESALAIERKLRAFDPIPGAYAALNGERIKLWRAEVIPTSDRQQPGTIVSAGTQGIDVACGQGSLRVLELQPAGRRRMSAAAFVAGRPIAKGATFTDEIPDPRRP